MSDMPKWEVVRERLYPDVWRVESVGSDGECYVTIFSGPDAEGRAVTYCNWMNS